MSRCWQELPQDQYDGLKQKLLTTMTQYQGPKIVLTRICVAMSGFIIHSSPDHWRDPITDIITMFAPHVTGAAPNMRSLTLLLELLTGDTDQLIN